eukprot:COSAG05_NODE_1534_length_4616_cov_6.656409_10_plen_210_part_00
MSTVDFSFQRAQAGQLSIAGLTVDGTGHGCTMFAVASLAVAAGVTAAAARPFACSLVGDDSDGGSYACHRGTDLVMTGAPIACHVGGKWHVAGEGLRLERAEPLNGSDSMGAFTGMRVHWVAGATPFTTSVRNYAWKGASAAVFEYGFPEGATGTAHTPAHDKVWPWRTAYSTIANFPAMLTIAPRRALSWQVRSPLDSSCICAVCTVT